MKFKQYSLFIRYNIIYIIIVILLSILFIYFTNQLNMQVIEKILKNKNQFIVITLVFVFTFSFLLLLFNNLFIYNYLERIKNKITWFCKSFIYSKDPLDKRLELKQKDDFYELATQINLIIDIYKDLISTLFIFINNIVQNEENLRTEIKSYSSKALAENISVILKLLIDQRMEIEKIIDIIDKRRDIIINLKLDKEQVKNLALISNFDTLIRNIKNISSLINTSQGKIDLITAENNKKDEILVKSKEINKNTMESMEKVNKSTKLINGIIEETKLLAMNASIEAANIGEQGNGFLLIVEEIRKLTDQATDAIYEIDNFTIEINKNLNEIQANSENISETKNNTIQNLQQINNENRDLLSNTSGLIELCMKIKEDIGHFDKEFQKIHKNLVNIDTGEDFVVNKKEKIITEINSKLGIIMDCIEQIKNIDEKIRKIDQWRKIQGQDINSIINMISKHKKNC